MKNTIILLCFLMGSFATAQDFYDLNTIQTIEITFAQSNWDQLLDNEYASTGGYIMAQSVTINGEVFDSVGVKYKGNSTYQSTQTKNPLHIELDTYKDHIYEAYTDIKLSNVAKDPSFLREVLSYQILRQYMDAPLSNYANVYVNGSLIGLYSNSESISKKFVDDRFYSKNNAFIKCNPPAGAGPQTNDFPSLEYLGQDSTDYYDAYELKSDAGWGDLIDLCDSLQNNMADIEEILDVDRALWMLAFNNALVNLDSYSGQFVQNYYLYRDDHGRFLPVVWDLNESFGRFSMSGSGNLNSTTAKQQMSHLLHENDSNYPLIQQLLSVPTYKKKYVAHLKTMMLENFANNSYYQTGLDLQNLVDGSVQADQNKFFTYNNFVSNLTSDVGGGGGPGGGSTNGTGNFESMSFTFAAEKNSGSVISSEFNFKVLLEGNYNPTSALMSTDLLDLGLVTNTHPYSVAPWNAPTASSQVAFPVTTVDWILIEAYSGVAASVGVSGLTLEESQIGFLLADGSIVASGGGSGVIFTTLRSDEDYYFMIRHRNHLDVLTAVNIRPAAMVAYDFSSSISSAFGIEQLVPMSDGKFAMHAGDYQPDGVIQTSDFDEWITDPSILNAYELTDGNLDGVVQNTDFDRWFTNKAKIGTLEVQY